MRNKINTMFIFPSFSISLFLVMFIFLSSVNRIENERRNLRGNFAKRRIIKKNSKFKFKREKSVKNRAKKYRQIKKKQLYIIILFRLIFINRTVLNK